MRLFPLFFIATKLIGTSYEISLPIEHDKRSWIEVAATSGPTKSLLEYHLEENKTSKPLERLLIQSYPSPITNIDEFIEKLKSRFPGSDVKILSKKGNDITTLWYVNQEIFLRRDIIKNQELHSIHYTTTSSKTSEENLTVWKDILKQAELQEAQEENISFQEYFSTIPTLQADEQNWYLSETQDRNNFSKVTFYTKNQDHFTFIYTTTEKWAGTIYDDLHPFQKRMEVINKNRRRDFFARNKKGKKIYLTRIIRHGDQLYVFEFTCDKNHTDKIIEWTEKLNAINLSVGPEKV
ncbi:MAG: hypothetical protein WDZ28_00230 [Simkaniaceae bacterium]